MRAGAGLAMLAAAAAIYGVAASAAFEVSQVDVEGLRYTDEATVRSRLDLPDATNLFALATEPLEARLRELPTVASAAVSVRLPDTLAVAIVEREPILVWQVGEGRHLVDVGGALFAEVPEPPTAEAQALPVLDDRRAASGGLGVGDTLDPVDLQAARQLGSLRPADLGSAAAGLTLELNDTHGFVVRPTPPGWAAVFGFYTPSLRTVDIIPGQVRTLRSLLLREGERNVARVILATADQGTFTTPAPSAAP